jgi:hypothetical protein
MAPDYWLYSRNDNRRVGTKTIVQHVSNRPDAEGH